MATALVVFWCEKCRKHVCEAVPQAAVWCSCGRRAKAMGAAKADGSPMPKGNAKVKGGSSQVRLPV